MKNGDWPLEFCMVIGRLVDLPEKFLNQPITSRGSSGQSPLFISNNKWDEGQIIFEIFLPIKIFKISSNSRMWNKNKIKKLILIFWAKIMILWTTEPLVCFPQFGFFEGCRKPLPKLGFNLEFLSERFVQVAGGSLFSFARASARGVDSWKGW